MTEIIGGDPILEHYGIIRKSGRYPWGSGEDPYQRSKNFYAIIDDLRKQGLSDAQIAATFSDPNDPKDKFTTTMLKQSTAIARNEIRAAERSFAMRLRQKGVSVSEIARRMNKNESSIRTLLDDKIAANQAVLTTVTNDLRAQVDEKKYLDIGKGNEIYAGVARDKFDTAVAALIDQGYKVYYANQEQLGVPGNFTTVKVLGRPDTEFPELAEDFSQIKLWGSYSEDKGESMQSIKPPVSIDSSRIEAVYDGEGGSSRDGLIELRRGAQDLDMGNSTYAQVRILVDDSHYIKGMAVVSDDLPPGVDIRFHTNKKEGTPLIGPGDNTVLKPKEDNVQNPFGAEIRRQKTYIDKDGKEQITALNIIQEEGEWSNWSKTLSSQFLSKQPAELAKQQLSEFRANKQVAFEEIQAITNNSLKKELLRQFSEKMDAEAEDLKAMGLPRTAQHVLIPIPGMKDNEVYAPKYNQGERVVLIRHPHGGIFEIPELIVNNKNPEARRVLGNQPQDAIGINSKVAEQLSGADFDGDTVLVIPNNLGSVKTSRPLKALQDFDPKTDYKGFEGMKVMNNTQTEMGIISNLITDMDVKGATEAEIVRAVKHSMVVIDAEKHKLNYKQSYDDHGIKQLQKQYQSGGASTLISRAKAKNFRVPQTRPRPAAEGGPIDKKTGEKRFVPKGNDYVVTRVDKKTGETREERVFPQMKSTPMREASDARQIMSSPTGTKIERIYADHANSLKKLANKARLEMINTPNTQRNKSAAQAYATEVAELKAALKVAQSNAPRERQAQIVAAVKTKARVDATPGIKPPKVKKIRAQELRSARESLGARKEKIDITPRQWEAIQAGALSHTPLLEILNNADPKKVKQYALPREMQGVTGPKLERARAMVARGHTQAEIADTLGVSVSAIQEFLKNN